MKRLIAFTFVAFLATSLFAQEDVTPPTLTGFSFSPDAVNVTSGPATVTYTINATDDLSGLFLSSILFISPSGTQQTSYSISFESGILEGSVTGSVTIPQYAEAGNWSVDHISLSDMAGNGQIYYTADLEAMGFPTILEVTSTPDVTPPTLTGFSFSPDAVNVTSGPATVTYTINATDDLSGLFLSSILFISPSGTQQTSYSISFESGILEGSVTGSVTIPQYAEAGNWSVDHISLSDMAGNGQIYYTADLEAIGLPTILNVYYSLGPEIISITDVLNDQGKKVRLSWAKSVFDGIESDSTIIGYSIWRRIDPLPEGTFSLKIQETPKSEISSLSFDLLEDSDEPLVACDASFPPGDWDFISTVPAIGAESYNAIVPTLADSTISDGMHWSVFTVIAHTDNPLIFFVSEPDSGYSLDNLAPHAPEGLLASVIGTDLKLTWNKVTDEDFNYYVIYRSTESGFDPAGIEPYATTIDTFFIDAEIEAGIEYYYRISAIDFSGNEGEFSEEVNATITGIVDENAIPESYALFQNFPNPFNPKTTIYYQLPKAGHVHLAVYNDRGQLVKTLVNDYQNIGSYSVVWDASKVSSGVYLYRLSSGGFSDVKKCIVLK